MITFYVYILECSVVRYNFAYGKITHHARNCIGHTDNIDARISQHKLGTFVTCYTYSRRPVKVLYVAEFGTRDEAFNADPSIRPLEGLLRASGIKGWTRKKKRALINGDFKLLKYLAKRKK